MSGYVDNPIILYNSKYANYVNTADSPIMSSFFSPLTVALSPFEKTSVSLTDIEDRDESGRIDGRNGIADLGNFQTRYDAVQNHGLFPFISPFTVDEGYGTAHVLGKALGDGVMFSRHDEHPFHFVETGRNDVDHLIGNEVGDEGIHSAVPRKDEA